MCIALFEYRQNELVRYGMHGMDLILALIDVSNYGL